MGLLHSSLDLVALIREDLRAHRGDAFAPGFQTLAVHRFGNWRMGIGSKLARAPLSMTYRAMERFCRSVYGIELPYSAKVGRGVVIEHQGDIVVHGRSEIGDGCVLRQGVTLGARVDPQEAPRLGRNVDIGAGAKILGDVVVGDDAAIGANAVVLEDVPAGALAVGVPARLKRRKSATMARSAGPESAVAEAPDASG